MIPFQTFLARAAQEAGRYGDDPWVFLRELVQNSRDAHARHIEFTVTSTDDVDVIVCEDDGNGMNTDVVERYLLRLYASTKGQDGSVGFFGVGFWSILRFQPRTVTIMSRSADGEAGFELDAQSGTLTHLGSIPAGYGTRLVITRKAGSDPSIEDELTAVIRERLLWYAAHVRPFPGEDPIELRLNGERLDREFPLPPYGGRHIRGKGFCATVGFGLQPSVRIYTAGILVRDLISLDEVIPSHGAAAPRGGWGLYPVVAINADGLRVLMDRQGVYESEVLKRAVQRCEKELLIIHRRVLRGMLPMDLRNVWWRTRRSLRPAHALAAVLLVATLVAIRLGLAVAKPRFSSTMASPISALAPRIPSALAPRVIDGIETGLRDGASPGSDDRALPWAFYFDGPPEAMFIARLLTGYDLDRGFRSEPLYVQGLYPEYPHSPENAITVRMQVSGRRLVVLPVPLGHVVVARSVLHEGVPLELWRDRHDQAMVMPPEPGWLSYATVQRHLPVSCAGGSPPTLPWPPRFLQALAASGGEDVATIVEALAVPVRESFVYVRGDEPMGAGGTWLERALALGAGDCDVINGVMVLLLRSAGIEAHLAVAILGEHGRATPSLHALAAYCDQGWRFIDLTASLPSRPAYSEGVPAANERRTLLAGRGDHQRGRTSPAILPITFLGIVAGAVFAAVSIERRARRAMPDPSHIRYLFGHLLESRALWADLAFRPAIPLIGGRRVSLYELEHMAARGPLLGADPKATVLPEIRSCAVIDRSAEVVGLIEPFLPPIIWLDDLDLMGHDLSPELSRVERVIMELDPGFRMHLVPGMAIGAVEVPLREQRGDRHVLLGRDHPLCAVVEAKARQGPAGLLDAVGLLMKAVPIYPHGIERLLEALASARGRDFGPGPLPGEPHG